MSEFFRTGMGQQFFQGTMPRIADQLKRIADGLERRVFSHEELKLLQRSVKAYIDVKDLPDSELSSLAGEHRYKDYRPLELRLQDMLTKDIVP